MNVAPAADLGSAADPIGSLGLVLVVVVGAAVFVALALVHVLRDSW